MSPASAWPPLGYTVRIEENAGEPFYRAVRIAGPEWQSPRLRAVYEAALSDAQEHAA